MPELLHPVQIEDANHRGLFGVEIQKDAPKKFYRLKAELE
jgi:hypothetical protein